MPPFGPIDPLPRLKVRQTLAGWFDLPADHIEHLTTVEVRQAAPGVAMPGEPGARDQGLYRSGDWTTHASIEGALCDQAGLRPRQ